MCSNIYTRRVLAGEFQIVCPWLLRELVELGLWNDDMKNMIIANNGSVQTIDIIPDDVKAIYKTVWEISQKKVLDLAADRGAFICQSQSLNVHLQAPTTGQLTSMHFYGWKKGLKTGMYYLRTRPAAQAIKFTVDSSFLKDAAKKAKDVKAVNGVAAVATVNGVPHSSTPSPATPAPTTPRPATPIKEEPVTPSLATPKTNGSALGPEPVASTDAGLANAAAALSLDERMAKAAAEDPEFAAALQRAREKELEQAKLMCSIENKEACLMCSG